MQIYADKTGVRSNLYTISMLLGRQGTPDKSFEHMVDLHPVAAKTLAMMLRSMVKSFEEHNGTIVVPLEIYQKIRVAPEDW